MVRLAELRMNYSTTGEITVLYTLIFTFLDMSISNTNWKKCY